MQRYLLHMPSHQAAMFELLDNLDALDSMLDTMLVPSERRQLVANAPIIVLAVNT